jgi:hypothetical protein
MATPQRQMCKAILAGKHAGDLCPNYAGGPFFEHYCHKHTAKTRIQPDIDTCSVCLDDVPVEYRTGCCKRTFCRDSLSKHQKVGGTTCPSCRAPMGIDRDSVEYQWLNLRHRAGALAKRVKTTKYLASKEALGTHMLALMDTQKAKALEDAKKSYDEHVKEIEEGHAMYSNAWINNTDNYREDLWKDAERVRHTVSNLAILRSSRFPDTTMAEMGMRMVKEATETIDDVFESEDVMGILYADEEEMEGFMDALRERLAEGIAGAEEGEEDSDEEDSDYSDDEEEETCSGSGAEAGAEEDQWEDEE